MLSKTFCKRLRVFRIEKGWTQENMADELGLSFNGYAKIERGESDVSLMKIEKIAKVLEIQPIKLLIDQEDSKQENLNLLKLVMDRLNYLENRMEELEKRNN